jgi:hypothetical protein
MDFLSAKEKLKEVFVENNFELHLKNGLKHVKEELLSTCGNGSQITVSFPGYKAYKKQEKVVYDYRIDIHKNGVKTALSHANIITDIYNKIKHGRLMSLAMSNALISLSKEGPLDMKLWMSDLLYRPVKPGKSLLDEVEKAHLGKVYNRLGNSFDLTLEEMFLSIKWIVIQEDLNYPISENFEGRRMSFARYLETVFITQNNKYSLEDVLKRTLLHKRPIPWIEMDYSFIDLIH